MEKVINRQGIKCAGVSFTENTNEKLKKYAELINNHIDEEVSYVELQNYIEQEIGISKSATREDIPFLYNNGFLSDYKSNVVGKIKLRTFLTELGIAYLETVQAIQKAQSINQDGVVQQLKETLSLIMALSIIHRKKNNMEEYYIDMLRFIYKNGSINEDEFYLMIKSEDELQLQEDLKEYRDGNLKIILKKANNVFGYTKSFLKQANLIKDAQHGRLILNENTIEIVKKLVE